MNTRKEMSSRQIKFFGQKGKFAILSNFHFTPMTIDGKDYQTVEHFFQSSKFQKTAPEYAETIRLAKTPKECKDLGKSRNYRIHPHWNYGKQDEHGGDNSECIWVMRRGLFNKALQSRDFYELLMSTGNAEIIEASPWDSFWGEGKDGKGKNMLGVLLMELRTKLQKAGNNFYSASE